MNIYYIILLYFIEVAKTYLIVPLKFTNINASNDEIKTNYLSRLYSAYLYSNMSIGSNKEEIKGILDMEQIGFFIYENAYNYNSSSSFLKDNKTNQYYKRNNEEGFLSNDTLCIYNIKDINNPKIEKCNNENVVKFVLLKKEQKNIEQNIYENYSIIGLQLNNYYDENNMPLFINSFKKADLIEYYIFSFLFNKEDINNEIVGYLLLGYEYEESDDIEIKQFSSINKYGHSFWFISFDIICAGLNNSYDTSTQNLFFSFHSLDAELVGSLPFVVGTYDYNMYIKFHFFYYLLLEKICNYTAVPLNPDYSTYVCDSKSESFIKDYNTKFPKLYFQHNESNTTFILDKGDLFSYNLYNESDNLIYFLVFFYNHSGQYDAIKRLKLGMPFFKKYKFSFNTDAKIIKYYEKVVNKNKKDKNEIEEEKNYTAIKIIIIILLLIIFFGLGVLFHKIITKSKRKKKANELDDDYEYPIINHNKEDNNDLGVNKEDTPKN